MEAEDEEVFDMLESQIKKQQEQIQKQQELIQKQQNLIQKKVEINSKPRTKSPSDQIYTSSKRSKYSGKALAMNNNLSELDEGAQPFIQNPDLRSQTLAVKRSPDQNMYRKKKNVAQTTEDVPDSETLASSPKIQNRALSPEPALKRNTLGVKSNSRSITRDISKAWVKKTSKTTGQVYYYNTMTKNSQWMPPPDFDETQISNDRLPSSSAAPIPVVNNVKERSRLQLFQEIYYQNCEKAGVRPLPTLKNEIDINLKNKTCLTFLNLAGQLKPQYLEPLVRSITATFKIPLGNQNLENMTVQMIDISNNTIGLEGFFQLGELIDSPFPYRCFIMNNMELGDKGAIIISTYLYKSNAPLTHLYIDGNQLSNQGMGHIVDAIKGNKIFKTFHASHNKIDTKIAEKLTELLVACNTIIELAIADCTLTDEGMKTLFQGLSQLPKIEYLDFRNCSLTSNSNKWLQKLLNAQYQNITHLALAQNSLGDRIGEIVAKVLMKKGCTLTHINLGYCKLSSAMTTELCKQAQNRLTTLDLSGNPLKKKGVANLVESLNDKKYPQQKIKSLRLQKCGLTKNSLIQILTALKKNTTIRDLDLADNHDPNSTIDCGTTLQDFLSVNKSIEELDFGFIGLTITEVFCLVKGLTFNTSLKKLDIKGAKISDHLSKLAEAVLTPHSKVEFLDITNGDFSLDNFESFLAELCEFQTRQEQVGTIVTKKKLLIHLDAPRYDEANAIPRISSKLQKLNDSISVQPSDFKPI